MKDVVIIRKHSENLKSSVYGSHDYGCNFCIAGSNESSLRKRGYHLTDDEVIDIIHNLPKEFKKYLRFIDDESKAAHYDDKDDEVKDSFEEAKANLKKEVEAAKEESAPLKDLDYSKMNEQELTEFRNALKQYAKNNNIKIHPALKDVEKIIEAIKKAS